MSFTPIAPLSVRLVTGCSIVKGKDHNYLYLYQSYDKKSNNFINIINPKEGKAESVDLEKFAKNQKNNKVDDITNLIDPDDVKQIIMICFDNSNSMNESLDAVFPEDMPDERSRQEMVRRTVIATQYFTSFVNKSYGYRIPCILGLMTFNNKLIIRCPFSPLIPDFEEKGL